MRDNTARGEECRIASSLPFKLIVQDRRIAIIPLDLARPDGPVLLVRPSSLLMRCVRCSNFCGATQRPNPTATQPTQRPGAGTAPRCCGC